jgi:hypothetical protein
LNKITTLIEIHFNVTQFNTCVVKITRNVKVSPIELPASYFDFDPND